MSGENVSVLRTGERYRDHHFVPCNFSRLQVQNLFCAAGLRWARLLSTHRGVELPAELLAELLATVKDTSRHERYSLCRRPKRLHLAWGCLHKARGSTAGREAWGFCCEFTKRS